MLAQPVAENLQPLQARAKAMAEKLAACIDKVKSFENQEAQDFLARSLYDITGNTVMSLLILDDATRAPELFEKSARVYVPYAEAEVARAAAFIDNFDINNIENYRMA